MQLSNFRNNDSARIDVNCLDRVETKPIYYLDEDEEGNPAFLRMKNHCATYNATTGKLIAPATKSYAVLQHSDAFSRILDVVERILGQNSDAKFYVEGLGNRARLWILVPSARDNSNLIAGIRITNSYDMSVSLQGDLVVWYVPGDFPIIIPDVRHLGLYLALPHRAGAFKNLEERVQDYLQNALSGETKRAIEAAIDKARGISLVFNSDEEKEILLKKVLVGKKHASKLTPLVPDRISRWDLFLLITDYVNKESFTALMRDIVTQKAMAFLRKSGPGWDNFYESTSNRANTRGDFPAQ